MALWRKALARSLAPSRATCPSCTRPALRQRVSTCRKEAGKGSEVAAAKGGDAGVVGVLIGCQHAEGQLFPGGLLDLARRGLAHAVGVEQELHHEGRVIAGAAAQLVLLVGAHDLREVEAVRHVTDEPDQAPRGAATRACPGAAGSADQGRRAGSLWARRATSLAGRSLPAAARYPALDPRLR